jgi:hypothetical protein
MPVSTPVASKRITCRTHLLSYNAQKSDRLIDRVCVATENTLSWLSQKCSNLYEGEASFLNPESEADTGCEASMPSSEG